MSCRVSVQICSFNRRELLERCLLALFETDFPPGDFEIVLVDDGSTDGTGAMVASLRPPCRLHYVRQEHAGLAAARNAGIRAATGEVVLFIDDDTLADRALVSEHWASHLRHPRAIVMGWVNHVDPGRRPARRRVALADVSTSFFWTSNASVRRRDLIAAGLFDTDFTEYGWEDIELGERLRDLGLVRRRNARAIVSHLKPPWRAEDVASLVARAEASGRTAALLVRKRPTWRVRLATGVTPLRIRANESLRLAERWCTRRMARLARGPLGWRDRLAVSLMTRLRYFRAVRSALAASKELP